MSKQRPTVEWIVAESDAKSERLCPAPVLNLASKRHRRLHLRRAFWCVTALLLLLASAISVGAPAPISPVAKKSSQLWLLSPSQVGIPLLCSRLKLEATYFPWYYLDLPTHLAQFNLPLTQHDQLEERRDRGLSVA